MCVYQMKRIIKMTNSTNVEKDNEQVVLSGEVCDITYQNEDNGYAIFDIETDGEYVTVDANGTRRTRFYDVQVRVHKDFRLEMHLDTDDANAAGLNNGDKVTITK